MMDIVILGGGFAGTRVAKILEKDLPRQSARVSLVNRENFTLYTPFLPEAAAGTLEPRHVVTPLREVLHRTHIRVGQVSGHDPERGLLVYHSKSGHKEQLHYDRLVISLGSVSKILAIAGLQEHAITFKSLPDAIYLRNTLLESLEEANSIQDKVRQEELLTFVFVGAGYAGLEAIAELQDFAAQAIEAYPAARLHGMRWVLIDSASRVLSEIDAPLADYAAKQLRSRGIEIYNETTLERVEKGTVYLSGGRKIKSSNLVWTAGVSPNPLLQDFHLPLNERGQIRTNLDLTVPGYPHIWALGDCAEVKNTRGQLQPPAAQHALRQAEIAGNNLLASLGLGQTKKYSYDSKNAFVNLGRFKAVGRIGPFRFSGVFAWWLARTYHLLQIPGRSRKIRAVLDWTVSLLFQRDLAELGSLRDDSYRQGSGGNGKEKN